MAAAFLQTRPRCAFTCARPTSTSTNNLFPIVGRDHHLNRIVTSYRQMFLSSGDSAITEQKDGNSKRLKLDEKSFVESLERYFDPLQACDCLLVVLAYPDAETGEPCIERKEFPFTFSGRSALINLVVTGYGGPRSNPSAKDSEWISTRKPLEQVKAKYGADELILSQHNGKAELCLFEGLITNFFVVLKGKDCLVTAPDGLVLEGTMRRLVIDRMKDIGFKVILETPKWENRADWAAAFLTSVTKPCAFIKRIMNVMEENQLETIALDPLPELMNTISIAIEGALTAQTN